MNKYYLIKKQTNEIRAISDGVIGFDKNIFEQKQITTTKTEDDLINQNYRIKIVDGKLEFEAPPDIKAKEDKENLIESINGAKDLNELKTLIIDRLI